MAKTSSPVASDSEPSGSSSSPSSSSSSATSSSAAKSRAASRKTANKASSTDAKDEALNNSPSLLSKMVVALAVLAALALATFTLVPYVSTDVSQSGATDSKVAVDFEAHKSNLNALGLFNIQSQEHFDAVTNHTCALVVYKATWCGHCKKLMPQLEEAAKSFAKHEMPKGASGVISFVECTEEGVPKSLCDAAEIQGYPTLHLYSYGEKNSKFAKYESDSILAAMKDCVAPAFAELSSEDAATLLKKGSAGHVGTKALLLFYLKDKKSAKFDEAFNAAKKLRFNFKIAYTTDEALFKKLFNESKGSRTTLEDAEAVLVHSEEAPLLFSDPKKWSAESLKTWVEENKIPLVGTIDPETYEMYSTGGKRILFFFHTDDAQRAKFRPVLAKIAKKHQKTKFVVFLDANKFGGHGTNMGLPGVWPDVAIQDLTTGEKWLRKESLASKDSDSAVELTAEQIEKLADGVHDGSHDAHLKSEPIPTGKDAYEKEGSPRNIVSLNFDDVAIKQKARDVVVFFHAPWCGHCKSFSPTYSKISALLHSEKAGNHVELTKMDATKNDVPKSAGINIKGFPTIVLYRADEKKPLTYEGDRSYENVLKWIRENGTHGSKLPTEEVASKFVEKEPVSNVEL